MLGCRTLIRTIATPRSSIHQKFTRNIGLNAKMETGNVKPKVAPFTRAVVAAMRRVYPEALADKSFDNTGLLLEAPFREHGHLKNSALVTVDLTTAVADEAIRRKDSIIIAYHPIIFRGLKSLTQADTQTTTLLRLAQEGISVYCPHTAVDAATGGLNDWLADIFLSLGPSTRTNITPLKTPVPAGFETAGYGRIVRFSTPQTLGSIVRKITEHTELKGVSVAAPQGVVDKPAIEIESIGICAGSGGSMLNGLDVDLLFTGELSHHEALAAIEKGKCVITTFHSNSERGFFRKSIVSRLSRVVDEEVGVLRRSGEIGEKEEWKIDVSEVDCDPFSLVINGDVGW
ncbi:hypothetical protein HYFRA_00008573 [Hymenoscyphus fraxineus]|uniref:NGG1p interacting factor 3 n=1 Tax=Hymenoscyphus fraxineus TaxID=746836 RepID=A0A9N9KZD3_9HELO|nr:hypothetical protein HYFRA_00008573 [Hymenoscyphus fraxineus]